MKKLLFCFSVLLLAGCLVAGGVFRLLERSGTPLPTDADRRRVIVIDAGHGGEDGGAVGVNGVLEKDLNLSLARTLADLLRGGGFTVIETRTEDKLLYSESDKNAHRKRGDLVNRQKYMEKYPDSVFISIHMNTYPTKTCKGLQVWYAQNGAESEALAGEIQNRVSALLQPENKRKTKKANSTIYLLQHATVPAVLVECGFLSTPEECEKLSDETYRRELALAIFSSVSEFLVLQ